MKWKVSNPLPSADPDPRAKASTARAQPTIEAPLNFMVGSLSGIGVGAVFSAGPAGFEPATVGLVVLPEGA